MPGVDLRGRRHWAMPPPPFWLCLLVKRTKVMVPSDWNMPALLMVSVAYGHGRIQGAGWEVCNICILPSAIFKHVFDAYNFSIISNLFDSNKPCSLARINENVRTQYIVFDEALTIKVKKFKQNLPENYSKSTKIAIAACKFSKFFRGSKPPDSLKLFLVSQSALNLFCRKKKYPQKNVKIMVSPLLKFLDTPLADAVDNTIHWKICIAKHYGLKLPGLNLQTRLSPLLLLRLHHCAYHNHRGFM